MSRSPEPDWVFALREASRSTVAIAHGEVEVMRGARPSLFDGDLARALSSTLLAAFVVAAAIFRERLGASGPLDLLALLLRASAFAFVLRALLCLAAVVRRVVREGAASDHVLAFGTAGIYLRNEKGEAWAAKDDVLGIALPEQPEGAASRSPRRPLSLVLKPSGEPRALPIPPYFAGSQEILAARLTRWLSRPESEPLRRFDPPKENPEGQYARIAQGNTQAGEVRVPEGFGYRARAPYGALLGCVFAIDTLRTAGPLARDLWPAVSAACALSLVLLGAWFVWMNGRRRSRLGIAMALTREEMLMRGKAGVVGIPWGQFSEIDVDLRLTWSPFYGSYPVRVLSLSTLDGERILFDGGFLGVPPEHVAWLCESYRRKLV